MKLLAKSPSGVWFAFDVDLTGNIQLYAGTATQVDSVEVHLRGEGAGMIVQSQFLQWSQPLWVAPMDLCDESNGGPFQDQELIEMTERIRNKTVGPV